MKLLLAHNYYQQPGGEDVVFATELSLLRDRGHDIRVWEKHNREIKGMGRLQPAMSAVWSRASANELRHILNEFRPDLVHFHNTFPLISSSAYYACVDEGVPVVQTLHNYRLLCLPGSFYRDGKPCEKCVPRNVPWPGILHKCYHNSISHSLAVAAMLTVHNVLRTWRDTVDVYIALTEFSRSKFVSGGLPGGRVVVKPNFVFPDPEVKHDVHRYVLFVGRLSTEKGLGTLLEAWLRMRSIPLKIVGDGPLLDEINKIVLTRRLSSVEVLGRIPRDEVLALYMNAICLVFPSELYENFPLSLAEAFARGIPVVASKLGAMKEIVDDHRTGLLFAPGDSVDLAAKIMWLWSHPKLATEMGSEARIEYMEKYSAEKNYEMLMSIYQKAMVGLDKRSTQPRVLPNKVGGS